MAGRPAGSEGARRPRPRGSVRAGDAGAGAGANGRHGGTGGTSRHRHHRRLGLLSGAVVLVALALVARLLAVQVLDGPRYAAATAREVMQQVILPAMRGTIYDRNGNVLAASVPRVDVIADDFLVSHPRAVAGALAGPLHLSAASLLPLLSERNGYVRLARQIGPAEQQQIAQLSEPAISFVADDARLYPSGSILQPLLGGVNAPSGTVQGDGGLELQYNEALAGRDGSEVVPESPLGLTMPGSPRDVRPAEQGRDLVLTIDEPLQVEVTKDVTAEMRASHAHSGVAVIMSVHSGAILAMVDLVRARSGAIVPAPQNLAVTGVYEPGSVMKLATISYAVQDHLVTPSTELTVPWERDIGGYWFQDAEYHPTEQLSVATILAQSSNIGTSEIAARLGPTRLAAALADLGFGKPTPLAWPGQSAGLVSNPSTWYGSTLPSMAIGTGEGVTPLQILDAYTAVANDGVSITPHLVAATVNGAGVERAVRLPPGRRLLDASTVHSLVPMFAGVVKAGTAPCASISGYEVAGKTGTAQVLMPNGKYSLTDFNATFVGFVPAQRPSLSGIVVLNHPTPIYGGSVSAPVFSAVMGYALRHFDIPPPPGPVVHQGIGAYCSIAQ